VILGWRDAALTQIFESWAAGKQIWKVLVADISSYSKIRHMNDHTSDSQSEVASDSEIESLARETGTPVDTVQEIYRVERDKLERSARIKTFVSVLAHRRVKALLQVERGNRH
jgi:hypothetical protein